MSDLVERLALAYYAFITAAVAEVRPGGPFKTWDELPDEQRVIAQASIRAVLSELERTHRVVPLEPTEEMMEVGSLTSALEDSVRAKQVYTAMLSAAPKVGEG